MEFNGSHIEYVMLHTGWVEGWAYQYFAKQHWYHSIFSASNLRIDIIVDHNSTTRLWIMFILLCDSLCAHRVNIQTLLTFMLISNIDRNHTRNINTNVLKSSAAFSKALYIDANGLTWRRALYPSMNNLIFQMIWIIRDDFHICSIFFPHAAGWGMVWRPGCWLPARSFAYWICIFLCRT